MSDDILISTLKASKLMRSREEVLVFNNALSELAQNTVNVNLEELYLVLDDNCEHEEVMWDVVHFLEFFDAREQFQALQICCSEASLRSSGMDRDYTLPNI